MLHSAMQGLDARLALIPEVSHLAVYMAQEAVVLSAKASHPG